MSAQDFVNQATKLGVFLESIGKARAVLEAAAAVENGAQSRTEAAAAAQAAERKARAELAEAQDALKAAQSAVQAANNAARQVKEDARARADGLLKDATEQAARTRAVGVADVAAARAQLEALNVELRTAEKYRDSLLAQGREAAERFAAIKAEALARFGG